MAWLILLAAGLFEIVWAVGLKYTEGFTKPVPVIITLIALAISFALLAVAMKELPVGTAYAVWTGIGAVGTVIVGIVLLGEPANAARMVCIALIVCGIAGLKIFTPQ
jgi:quaternary ammonium compound-resistance protein SugE